MSEGQFNKENLKNGSNRKKISIAVHGKQRLLNDSMSEYNDNTNNSVIEKLKQNIYNQRIKSRCLHQQIKKKMGYFQYDLIPKIRIDDNQAALIRYYDGLLDETTFLQRTLAKIQCQNQDVSSRLNDEFGFLINVWNRSEHAEINIDERIDRLNKNIRVIKNGIETVMNQNHELSQISSSFIRNSSEYKTLENKVCRYQQQLQQAEGKLDQSQKQREAIEKCFDIKSKDYMSKIEQYQKKIKHLEHSQKQFITKINRLNEELLKRDKQNIQLKSNQKFNIKYVSDQKNQQNEPIFQISIKIPKSQPLDRSVSLVQIEKKLIGKSLQSICDFLDQSNLDEYLQNIQELNNMNLSNISLKQQVQWEPSAQNQDILKNLNIQNLQNIDQKLGQYSSNKKKHTQRNRERDTAFSNKKQTQNTSLGNLQVNQLRFIRRK